MDGQENARWRDWVNILGRVRFGTQKIAGRTISGTMIKAVGGRLAEYGSPDGTEVRPGIARIAVDLESSHTTVRNAIKVLERVGLLRLVSPGTRRRAALYRLIIGAELIESVELWSPARHALEVKHVADQYRGHTSNADSTGVSDEDETPTPQESALSPDDHQNADSSGVGNSRNADSSGSETPTPQESATSHRPLSNYDQPTEGNLRTDPAAPRARADPTPIRPPRCPKHGLAAGYRPDGQPRCPICRRLPKERAA